MYNTIIKSCNLNMPSDAKLVYRKCDNCGQIICNTEFDGSIFISTNCPKCNIPFITKSEKFKHTIMTGAVNTILKENS